MGLVCESSKEVKCELVFLIKSVSLSRIIVEINSAKGYFQGDSNGQKCT